jgi:putative polyhydroxyalkanoate system protein
MTWKPLLVRRSHALPIAELRGRLERAALLAQERHRVAWRWRGDGLEVLPPPGIAAGARGLVTVGERDLRVELHLPILYTPARAAIEHRITRKLDEMLQA